MHQIFYIFKVQAEIFTVKLRIKFKSLINNYIIIRRK